jgi:Holliday junction DNA helicase RuvB P-loop domain
VDDPFTEAERETRGMVTAGWWPSAAPAQRQNLTAARMLALPDGTWWIFGAWARWYRWTPADAQWYLCPPPRSTVTRMSARPLQQGLPVPQIPPHVVPAGPDFVHDAPAPAAFVGESIPPTLTSRVRATVESAAALSATDYPHRWGTFSPAAPSTVPVTWGVMLWSAAAPVFDARFDSGLIELWAPHRVRPLPAVDGPRWLTPPPLEAIVGLYAERLRAGRVDAAVVVLRTMWAMATALREDPRFQARADALLAVLGTTLSNPTVDYGALPYGDQAIVQQWISRCPPSLAPAMRIEASAGDHFRNAFYDLASAVELIAGDASEPGYLEPRILASALLAADLAIVRQDVAGQVIAWLDPEVRYTIQAVLGQPSHPLRRLWPADNRLPEPLRTGLSSAAPEVRGGLLATMYGADLAWCRLGGGIPARPRGFPVPIALMAEILGNERATAAAPSDPVTPTPGIATLARQYPPNPMAPGQPVAETMAPSPPTDAPAQLPGWLTPGPAPSGPQPFPASPPQPVLSTRLDPGAVLATHTDQTSLTTPTPPNESGALGTMADAPMPERPVEEIEPPTGDRIPELTERFGIRFVSGPDDAAKFLDDLYQRVSVLNTGPANHGAHPHLTRSEDDPQATMAQSPSVLIVGTPQAGQRRITRLIARTLAEAGTGDGSVRASHADEVRGEPTARLATILGGGGDALLFERLDSAILEAANPAEAAAVVVRARRLARQTTLIATCEPTSYARLKAEFAELVSAFTVFRLPGFGDLAARTALLHLLGDERRVTIGSSAMESIRSDLARLRGRGDLVNARLVESYLDRACTRRMERPGVTGDRLDLLARDFAGVAEQIEPALRPPGDVDGFLTRLDEMIGLDEVKEAISALIIEARSGRPRSPRHLIFLGRPGTGRTTVAELIGGAYAALNLLDSGHVVRCDARDLIGQDAAATEARVAAQVERATGGVLLIKNAYLLDRRSAAVTTLRRLMRERADRMMVICSSLPVETEGSLSADPAFRAEFGAIVRFGEFTDRELVRLISRFAERDLYLLDEELRVELLSRFAAMRGSDRFAYATTARRVFDQTVARQAARLAGGNVTATSVARLSVRDLPDTPVEQLLRELHPNR